MYFVNKKYIYIYIYIHIENFFGMFPKPAVRLASKQLSLLAHRT